jgi:D-glycero-alpha-D-manno-heptose-7-phosphate kinase
VRHLPPFFEHKYRVVYSKIESINSIDEIVHPSVRESLRYFNCKQGVEIHHDGDLPARSGLGSSSSFTVGLVNAMNALKGSMGSAQDLATTAIHIEQDMIKENVGSQDQIAAAYGGFNEIDFNMDGTFSVNPIIISQDRKENLNDHLMLFYTGISRFSSEVTKSQLENMKNCNSQMREMYGMVDEGLSILTNDNSSLDEFGLLLNDAWKMKRSLSNDITNSNIDDIYDNAIKNGASGGKILGAGGGGFILFFAKPEYHNKIKKALKGLTFVPFKFENSGSKVVLYQPNGF